MPKYPITEAELENLVACYINVEGYTDFRSIYSVMKQEYPGEFDHKKAMQVIKKEDREAPEDLGGYRGADILVLLRRRGRNKV